MKTTQGIKPYLVRFFLTYATIEFYFDTMEEFNKYYKDLKDTREVKGYEFIRKPSLQAV